MRPDDPANRALLDEVHPAGWRNPEPAGRYNLVVVGAGTAGLVSAAGAAGLGARVALIERHLMGGDCLNTGCVPSKALIASARVAAVARTSGRFGVTTGDVGVEFEAVMRRMRAERAGIAPDDGARRFRDELGVDVFFGEAAFSGRDTIDVGGVRLRFARAVIATGARAAAPPISGLKEAGFLTNETLFELTELPARLTIIGAGPIGCEMAQSFARFGSEVTLVEAADRIMLNDDPDAAAIVAGALARDGVRLLFGAGVERVDPDRTVVAGDERIASDAILVAAGRRPNVDGLGLDAAGVDYDRRGVRVDDRLRTSNKRIYAAGDVCSKLQFTHAADAMARVVLRNALFYGRARASAAVIPWATFTDPEVAHVGLTPAAARAEAIDIDTYDVELADNHRARLDGDSEGFLRVHTRAGSDRIVGATLVSSHAGETIGQVAMAMQAGLGLGAMSATVFPYPTRAEVLKRAGDAYSRTRLEPWVKRLFDWLLRRQRRG
jgi:pyruvate/2-oxoglutarate dehydrogenase complex dihydrolipoamide dehydrogenase (E3) component